VENNIINNIINDNSDKNNKWKFKTKSLKKSQNIHLADNLLRETLIYIYLNFLFFSNSSSHHLGNTSFQVSFIFIYSHFLLAVIVVSSIQELALIGRPFYNKQDICRNHTELKTN